MSIKKHFEDAQLVLQDFLQNELNFARLEQAGNTLVDCINNGGKIITCGNGGSMCDAMHFAEELTGRYRNDRPAISAISISDPSHITCVGNDYGFEFIFSRFVEGVGTNKDILFGISTSGNSENVNNAILAAKEKGMTTIALTGKNGGKIAENVDIEIRAPKSDYADRAQELHIKIIHSLIDFIERNLDAKKGS